MRSRSKRAKKKRIMIGAAAIVVAAAAGSTLIYWNLPGTRAGRKLNEAMEYMTEMDYVHAEEAYSEVLSLDETSIKAYRGLADDYVAQARYEDAEEILLEGYEATGDEVLLQNYTATILNGVVNAINEGTADFASMNQCLDVLEKTPGNENALGLLQTCAQRILIQEDSSMMMLDGLDGSETFSQYASFMDRMLLLAEADPATYGQILSQCAVIQASKVYMSLSNADAYRSILERAEAAGVSEAAELIACLDKQAEVSAYFAPMFAEFEAGNFEAAKSFIVSEEYTAIRDAFIEGSMEYWHGDAYVPVTKEAIVFLQVDGQWMFSYVEDDVLAQPTGAIRVLGQKMKDLGVQRSSIEYSPAYERGHYYPHTEYEIVYWNTMVSGIATDNTNVVSRMNYRFAEKIYTAEGMEANMIYDWGGSNEKRQKE